MKKRTLMTLLIFFILIPATLFLCKMIPGRSYYIAALLIICEMMFPLFFAFENRKPQARELVVISVLCAIAIVSRVAIPIPHFKPTFAVIILSAVALGPEAGFIIGAVTAFGSNFFAGQGAFTPWQMMSYGAGGLLAGMLSRWGLLSRKPLKLAIFGFFSVVLWVGPLLDLCVLFLAPINMSASSVMALFASGFIPNIIQASCTALTITLLGRPFLEKLDRIKIKYGMLEDGNGL